MNITELLTFIVNNWTLIITAIFVVIYLVQQILRFLSLPTSKKKEELCRRLLEWVRSAEEDLGSGTGIFKLAQVYDRFCEQYPDMKKWFTYEQFENLVNKALDEMEKQLEDEKIKKNAIKYI